VSLQVLAEADAILSGATRQLRLVSAVRPLNEPEQKRLFLADKVRQPGFQYGVPPRIDVLALKKLELPDTYWGELLATIRRRALRLGSIFEERRRLDVRDFSREVFGAPSERLQSVARNVLRQIRVDCPQEVSWDATRDVLELALKSYGLEGWVVKKAPGDFTAARAVEKTVYLTPVGKLYEGTAERLVVHEIGVHVVRAFNGSIQPLTHFNWGWPGYESTEEGLAVYAELHTGLLSAQAMANYAARVLAVASLDRGRSFRECFEVLRDLGLDDDPAWDATLRAYRGNGLFKDHIYLQGLLEMFGFVSEGGDWRSLFLGKVGLHHLSRVKQELEIGALKEPSVLPGFLDQPPVRGEMWSLVSGLVQTN
jgi:uncharacterized protein (TIGR02421 family)